MARQAPEWFELSEELTGRVMEEASKALQNNALPTSLHNFPQMAHWFFLDSLLFANQANRDGMHANALSITRQCLEALSVMELGLCRQTGREEILEKWWANDTTPGKIRKWLSENVWATYGSGLWNEPWETFMAKLTNAVQPYAHYTGQLAQWQMALELTDTGSGRAITRIGPRAYDSQKATRITLYHAILTYALGRIVISQTTSSDAQFSASVIRLGQALGKSRYLDGQETQWDQQFWAMVWDSKDGNPVLE